MDNKVYKQKIDQLGKTLLFYRERDNFTQEQVAERLGVSCPYVSLLENGKSSPSLKLLLELSNLYNVGLETLLPTANQTEKKPEKERLINMIEYLDEDRARTIIQIIEFIPEFKGDNFK